MSLATVSPSFNIADRLREMAAERPTAPALLDQKTRQTLSFRETEERADAFVRGLLQCGLVPGDRVLLLVKPSCDFFCLIWGLFRAGLVPVLLDPAMGIGPVLRAVKEAEPAGVVAIERVLWLAKLFPSVFRTVRFWARAEASGFAGQSLRRLLHEGGQSSGEVRADTGPHDLAAVLFTSGSTGDPKGVRYTHAIFDAQRTMLKEGLGIRPGEVDLSAFPLFSLFSMALGVSVVIPDMDSTRPARVDPDRILEAFRAYDVSYAFGSPAFWRRLVEREGRWPLSRVLMAGAPASVDLLQTLLDRIPAEGDVFTPYGATESLPISLPSARANLAGPAQRTLAGAGTWVGKPLPEVRVRIASVLDGPTTEVPKGLSPGAVGEIWVSSPVTTAGYFRRPEADARSKVTDAEAPFGFWHRMGDVGFLDDAGELWFCGRQSHRIEMHSGTVFPVQVEARVNRDPRVARSALVGTGARGAERIWLVIEPSRPLDRKARAEVADSGARAAQAHPSVEAVAGVEFRKSLPVDARHNAKIRREVLSGWIEKRRGP